MTAPPDLLLRLVDESRREVARREAERPLAELKRVAAAGAPALDFAGALRAVSRGAAARLAVIAEMKARTPTMGVLSDAYDPRGLAAAYEAAGAAAISVLCQETSFGGDPAHLAVARSACAVPLMRKDFVVTEHQVLEARAEGADAVLLIAAALSPERLTELLAVTRRWGMEALVEVHDEAEMEAALGAGAAVVGVNHRDLTTFSVDIGITERLRPRVPGDVLYVAESGIHSADDARRMRSAGADAVLVGEALMRAADPGTVLRSLSVAP
jgi:indole-3-glycerol phosphate synthase